MDGQSQYDLSKLSSEQLELLQEEAEDMKEEEAENQFELSQEVQEGYGYPQPDEKHNQHSFLAKAAFESKDTLRTTFLNEFELGRPLFPVRFMLKMKQVSRYYLDPILRSLRLDPMSYNGIANYFGQDVQNVTHSGMSNKGFAMNLNVTQKREMAKKKYRVDNLQNLKGGKQSP